MKVNYKINLDGIEVSVEAEYANYEELSNEVSKLKNRVIFDYNDLKEKIQPKKVEKAQTVRRVQNNSTAGPSSHLTLKQFNWLKEAGYFDCNDEYTQCNMTFKEAYETISQLTK